MKTRRAECQSYYVTNAIIEDYKKDLLEDYGITACIIIDDYDEFYRDLVSIIQKIRSKSEPIDIYKEPQIIQLSKVETRFKK